MILSKSDLAIGGWGYHVLGKSFLGIPTIAFAVAKNQVENLSTLIKYGFVAGDSKKALFLKIKKIEFWLRMIIKNKTLSKNLSQKSRELVDGFGKQRIYENIYPAKYNFRFANLEDSQNLLIGEIPVQ